MNAKCVVVLLLALEVSLSLCELPTPSSELVEKYHNYRATFSKRISTAFAKMKGLVAPVVEKVKDSKQGQTTKEHMETLQENPDFQKGFKVGFAVGQELVTMVDQTRMAVLGLYEAHLRKYIGPQLDAAIKNIKPILDKVLPTNDPHAK